MIGNDAGELLPVIQADRDAAMQAVPEDGSHASYMALEAISAGRGDDWPLVQAFAGHRIAFTPASAGVLVEAARAVLDFIGTKDMRVYSTDLVIRELRSAVEAVSVTNNQLGPNAIVIDEPDGFKPVSVLCGGNVYIAQAGNQITLTTTMAEKLRQALSTIATPASDGKTASEVERGAHALHEAEDSWNDYEWEYLPETVKDSFRDQARHVIRALAAGSKVASDGVEAGKDVFLVSLALSKPGNGCTTYSMSQSWRVGGTEQEAINAAILFASKEKPGFGVWETLVARIQLPVATTPTPDRFGEGYRAGVEASARVAEERAAAYSAIPRPHLLNAARLGEAERIATAIRALQPATGDEA